MLRQKAVISYLGMNERESVVIKSIFRIATWLQDHFEFPDFHETRDPDVVLVDGDDNEAVNQWKVLAENNKKLMCIMVSTDDVKFDNTVPLKRPITLNRVVAAFKTITFSNNDTKKDIVESGEAFRILIVDDSLPVRKYLETKLPELTPHRLALEFAASGEEAMEKIAAAAFDLIFLDVVMPGVDGYKVCKWVKANHPTCVVMLTSKKSPFDKVKGAMSGCDSYLVKPPQDLHVQKILEKQLEKRAVSH